MNRRLLGEGGPLGATAAAGWGWWTRRRGLAGWGRLSHATHMAATTAADADPFQSVELPEIIEEYLEQGTALCLAFNRRGTLLACGLGRDMVPGREANAKAPAWPD